MSCADCTPKRAERLAIEAARDGGYTVVTSPLEGGPLRTVFAGELPAVLDYVGRAFEPQTYGRVDVAELARRMSR